MSHHIHVPNALPDFIRLVRAAFSPDACIRAEQINSSVSFERSTDQIDDVGLDRDVRADRETVDFFRKLLGAIFVTVCDHDGSSAFGSKALAHRTPDAVGSAGYYCDFVFKFHEFLGSCRAALRPLFAFKFGAGTRGGHREPPLHDGYSYS